MHESFAAHLRQRLDALASRDLRRRLEPPAGVDLVTNDYLGLAADPALAAGIRRRLGRSETESGLGAPASRLLRGERAVHARLEERLARYKGTEAALLYPSGWQANAGVLTTLIEPGDRVLSDALNHASIIDALRVRRPRREIFPHLDVDAVARLLRTPHPGRSFLITESLFSMDGDIAPLDRYTDLCRETGAELIVDDAHATGLFGARGSGLAEEFGVADSCLAILSTGGKAMGLSGAFVACPALVRDVLINTSRPFVFSTAVTPLLAHALDASLDLLETEPERRLRVHALADRLRDLLHVGLGGPDRTHLGASVPSPGRGPIVPVVVGSSRRALDVARTLQVAGYDVRAVRPPTVPEGTARLRISVHADHDEGLLGAVADQVLVALRRFPADAATSDATPLSAIP